MRSCYVCGSVTADAGDRNSLQEERREILQEERWEVLLFQFSVCIQPQTGIEQVNSRTTVTGREPQRGMMALAGEQQALL